MTTPTDITEIERAYSTATGKAPYQITTPDITEFIENAGVDNAIVGGLQSVANELQDMREQLQEAKDLFADFIANYDRRLAQLTTALSIIERMDMQGEVLTWDEIKNEAAKLGDL